MLPTYWTDERNVVLIKRWEQEQRRLEALKQKTPFEEELITEGDVAAIDAQPVTADDLTALSSGMRGKYRDGDTRRFVLDQEQSCQQYNCWMVRGADGTPRLVSEPLG